MRDIVITSSVLIIAILLIRYLAKGRINPILQYALWMPVVFRLILPLPLWSSQYSVLNYIPSAWTQEETEENFDADSTDISVFYQDGYDFGTFLSGNVEPDNSEQKEIKQTNAENAAQVHMEPENTSQGDMDPGNESQAEGSQADTSRTGIEQVYGLLFIWAAGILMVGSYMLFYQIKWKQYLKKNRKLFQKSGNNGKYPGKLSVYTVDGLPSPCLSGNCIYLTKEMASDEKQLAHILAHEYCHYKHLDFLWVIVRCVLCAIYWFHPLVWAAAYVSKQDSELACDAAALGLLGEKERISYGKTLLQLVVSEDIYDKKRVGIASTMSGGEKGIKERITLIAGKRRYLTVVSLIAVILIAGFIAITFSGTVQGKEAEIDTDRANTDDTPVSGDAADLQDNLQETGTLSDAAQDTETMPDAEKSAQERLEAERNNALAEAEQQVREAAVLAKLDSYDAYITEAGSTEGVYELTNAKNPSDYVQAYVDNGEDALDEGMYLLEVRKGSDGSHIKIYGMYTKEYGCEGITILIADDSTKFDLPWAMMYGYGNDENLRLYESAEDGMPRTFAFQMRREISADRSEIYAYYLCDRYDTGTITLNQFKAEDYLAQMKARVSFKISPEESCIYVYDKDTLIGSIDVPASSEAMRKIDEVVLDGRIVFWDLGNGEDLPGLITAVGLQIDTDSGEEQTWYHGMAPLQFPVEYGNFGEREFVLGQAEIKEEYRTRTNIGDEPQTLDEFISFVSADSLLAPFSDEKDHYDAMIAYSNPCPSYTRISDTFGTRTNPLTGETKVHNGIDLAAEKGADILAAADGSVYEVGYDDALGNYVVLYHVLSGEYTYYACCDEILVSKEEEVTVGQKIATVGSTGRSTGPHLHFALSRNGEYVEPEFE